MARSVCLACLALLVSLAPAFAVEEADVPQDIVIEGLVKLDVPVRLKSSVVKILVNGGEKVTFVRTNGYFALRMEPGTHFLQVSAVGATFPQVKLEVSSRNRGRFKATVVHDGNTLSTSTDELTISPIAPEVYFEKREPFSPWSLLKSPVGIMVVVMVVGVFLMPMLMDSMDPEELKQMQEQMRTQPSLTGMLAQAQSAVAPSR